MTPDFILFTIIVFAPLLVMGFISIFLDRIYAWWVTYQENKYIRRARQVYRKDEMKR